MKVTRERTTIALALAGLLTALPYPASAGLIPAPTSPSGVAAHAKRTATVRNPLAAKLKGWAKTQLAADKARRAHRGSPTTWTTAGTPGAAGKPHRSAGARARQAAPAGPTTLVLYDTAGPYGFLGELYAMTTDNLAGHFGAVTAEPVSSYTAGQVNQYTATIYLGSTYYGGSIPDAIPAAFYSDVVATSRPVLWINDNIWNLANRTGLAAFKTKYGWDPTNSYFSGPSGSAGTVTEVDYKGQPLTRTFPAGTDGGVLRPNILTGPGYPAVTTLATAVDTSTSPATRFPWAIRSANLTYIGEIPFAYTNETNRIIALDDLLFDALAPSTPTRHRAMVRLEDISPADDPAQLMAIADYLKSQNIPYGFNIIPLYTDPNGYYNFGVPRTVSLDQAPDVVNAIKYMLANGGTIIDEGYTHQYRNVANPYSGTSGDDFEFFLSHINASNSVIWDGPVPEDSTAWASSRVASAKALFTAAGLPVPSLWVTPHYAASVLDYRVFAQNYTARYERSIYYAGLLSGQPINPSTYIGQFFPYVVRDVYGTTVLPENLGDYEPVSVNNNPVRLPADLIREAQFNLAVRDGFASFFYAPSNGVGPLQQTISGIQGLGYTFVSPATATS